MLGGVHAPGGTSIGERIVETHWLIDGGFALFGRWNGNNQDELFMSIYQKQTLPVQFLKFGVDSHGIIIPILKRGKDNFVKLPPATKRAGVQPATSTRAR